MLVYFYTSLPPFTPTSMWTLVCFFKFVFPVVKMELRASCMLNKSSSINPISQPLTYLFLQQVLNQP